MGQYDLTLKWVGEGNRLIFDWEEYEYSGENGLSYAVRANLRFIDLGGLCPISVTDNDGLAPIVFCCDTCNIEKGRVEGVNTTIGSLNTVSTIKSTTNSRTSEVLLLEVVLKRKLNYQKAGMTVCQGFYYPTKYRNFLGKLKTVLHRGLFQDYIDIYGSSSFYKKFIEKIKQNGMSVGRFSQTNIPDFSLCSCSIGSVGNGHHHLLPNKSVFGTTAKLVKFLRSIDKNIVVNDDNASFYIQVSHLT